MSMVSIEVTASTKSSIYMYFSKSNLQCVKLLLNDQDFEFGKWYQNRLHIVVECLVSAYQLL